MVNSFAAVMERLAPKSWAPAVKTLVLLAVAVIGFGVVDVQADTNQCREAQSKGEASVAEYYNPRVAQLDEMESRSVKLNDVKVNMRTADGKDNWLTLAELKARLLGEKGVRLRKSRGTSPTASGVSGPISRSWIPTC